MSEPCDVTADEIDSVVVLVCSLHRDVVDEYALRLVTSKGEALDDFATRPRCLEELIPLRIHLELQLVTTLDSA